MKIYYRLKSKLINYFSNLSWKKSIIILIILIFLIIILAQSLLYIEKRNWDNRVGELYYPLNFFTYIPNATNLLTFYRYFLPSDLPEYKIKIDRQNLKKLEQALPEEFFGSLPEKSVWVPAEFYADNKKYDIQIKNRGRMSRHWKYRKKSWRIKFTNDSWQGYQEINFILPEEKEFMVEDYGNYVARKLGLVTPQTWFARVKINNQPAGVYWALEHWNENFLERHGLPTDANFYREDETKGSIYADSVNSKKYTSASHSLTSDYTDLDILINCLNNCNDDEFLSIAKKIIDMDNFLAWQAQTAILGDDHQAGINIRLYFNPAIGKLQFFPVDVHQFKFDGQMDIHYNILVSRLLSVPEIIHQRNQVLWDYVTDKEKVEDDLKYYQDLWQQTKSAFYKDRIKRYSNLYFDYQVKDRYQKAENQYSYIKNLLSSKTPAEESKQVQIKFYNLQDDVVTFEIITNLFSYILLTKIEYQKDNLSNFKLYYDNNGNNIYDTQDLYLTKFIYNQDKQESSTQDFSQQLFAQRKIPKNYEELIEILPTPHRFFILAAKDTSLENNNFKFDLINAFSRDKIKY